MTSIRALSAELVTGVPLNFTVVDPPPEANVFRWSFQNAATRIGREVEITFTSPGLKTVGVQARDGADVLARAGTQVRISRPGEGPAPPPGGAPLPPLPGGGTQTISFSVPRIDFQTRGVRFFGGDEFIRVVTDIEVGTVQREVEIPTARGAVRALRDTQQEIFDRLAGVEAELEELPSRIRREFPDTSEIVPAPILDLVGLFPQSLPVALTELRREVSDLLERVPNGLSIILEALQRRVDRALAEAERAFDRAVAQAQELVRASEAQLRSDIDGAIRDLRGDLLPEAVNAAELAGTATAAVESQIGTTLAEVGEAVTEVRALRSNRVLQTLLDDPAGFVLDAALSEARRRFGSGLAGRLKALAETGLQAVLSDTTKQRLKARRGDG